MDADPAQWALPAALVAFLLAAAVIAVAGMRLVGAVDRLADRAELEEAVAGVALLAAATSLSGLVVSLVAALAGQANLAIGNSIGGIAAQTVFLVVADFTYRRANLEHAAASLTNVFSSFLLLAMLAIVAMAFAAPGATFASIHIASPLLLVVYLYGIAVGRRIGEEEMWRPRVTEETRTDEPRPAPPSETTGGLWLRFALSGAAIAAAGWVVGRSGLAIIAETAISGTFVGTFFTSVATSLPELVTTVAAVRAGALTLAVSGVIGGNAFDVLFISVADVAYGGSFFVAAGGADAFVVGWAALLTAIAGAGLLRRQREGVGFEGVAILTIYLLGLPAVPLIA